jgi:hypothetical protein
MEELRAESLIEEEKVFCPANLSKNGRAWLKDVAVDGCNGKEIGALPVQGGALMNRQQRWQQPAVPSTKGLVGRGVE